MPSKQQVAIDQLKGKEAASGAIFNQSLAEISQEIVNLKKLLIVTNQSINTTLSNRISEAKLEALVAKQLTFNLAEKSTIFDKTLDTLTTNINNSSTTVIPAGILSNWDKNLVTNIFKNNNLSILNLNNILIDTNFPDDKAQEFLSLILKTDRDLTTGSNIYELLDDWDDNKLTARDGAETTSTGFTNLFAQKNKFRPTWTTVAGAPSVANEKLELDNTEQVKTPSTFGVGTWEIDLTVAVQNAQPFMRLYAGGGSKYRICGWYTHPTNLYAVIYDDVDAAYIIQGAGAAWDVNQHTLKTTRNESGNWEIFFDGVSKGTATDTTTTSFDELHIYTENGATKYDNLKVY